MNIMFVRAASAWTPAKLFASGEQGAWYDPSDFSTMWQDTGRTTPVTATGQSVACIDDKSGRGNHATQGTASKRPVLQQDGSGYYYLDFDGTDDGLVTGNIDWSASDQMSVFAGVRKDTNPSVFAVIAETGDTGTVNGSFQMGFGSSNNGNVVSRGTSNQSVFTSGTPPITKVITGLMEISPASVIGRENAVQTGSNTGSQGTGNYSASRALSIGARAASSFYLDGRIYQLIVRAAATSGADLASAEAFVNGKTGAY